QVSEVLALRPIAKELALRPDADRDLGVSDGLERDENHHGEQRAHRIPSNRCTNLASHCGGRQHPIVAGCRREPFPCCRPGDVLASAQRGRDEESSVAQVLGAEGPGQGVVENERRWAERLPPCLSARVARWNPGRAASVWDVPSTSTSSGWRLESCI